MPNMRIIVIAVVALLSPTVAHASRDCMTKAEARKAYHTSYLYWHGKGRCWDASPRASHRHSKVGAAQRQRVKAPHIAKAKTQPEVVDAQRVQTPAERTLTPDHLRAWGNSMAAMTAEPSVMILDRWPGEELPQLRTKPTAAEDVSLINSRTVILVLIIFMVLLAVLGPVNRRRKMR